MKKFVKHSIIAGAMMAGLGTQAFGAASGQTSVSFNFPNIVILYYVSDVKFDVPASAFGADDSTGEGTVEDSTQKILNNYDSTSKTLSGDAAVTVSSMTLNDYKGVIENAWAVRGLAPNDIKVSISLDTADATNGSSKVTISNAIVDDGTNSGTSITFAAPGLANAHYGDVKFDIDFSNVTLPGLHSGAQYTVTAKAE